MQDQHKWNNNVSYSFIDVQMTIKGVKYLLQFTQ